MTIIAESCYLSHFQHIPLSGEDKLSLRRMKKNLTLIVRKRGYMEKIIFRQYMLFQTTHVDNDIKKKQNTSSVDL